MLFAPLPTPAWGTGTLATAWRASAALSTPLAAPATSSPNSRCRPPDPAATSVSIACRCGGAEQADAQLGPRGKPGGNRRASSAVSTLVADHAKRINAAEKAVRPSPRWTSVGRNE